MAVSSDTDSEIKHWSYFIKFIFILWKTLWNEVRAKLCTTSWQVFEIEKQDWNLLSVRFHSRICWRLKPNLIKSIVHKAYNLGEPRWIWYSWNEYSKYPMEWHPNISNKMLSCCVCTVNVFFFFNKTFRASPTSFAEEAQTRTQKNVDQRRYIYSDSLHYLHALIPGY